MSTDWNLAQCGRSCVPLPWYWGLALELPWAALMLLILSHWYVMAISSTFDTPLCQVPCRAFSYQAAVLSGSFFSYQFFSFDFFCDVMVHVASSTSRRGSYQVWSGPVLHPYNPQSGVFIRYCHRLLLNHWCLMIGFKFIYPHRIIIVAGILLTDPFSKHFCFFSFLSECGCSTLWLPLLNKVYTLEAYV